MKSKLRMLRIIRSLFVLLLILATSGVKAKNPNEIYAAANKAYMDQDYRKAIQNYEMLISMENLSPEVYYNLANSYYKTGEIAPAVLNYERALKLSPSDPDISYNLQIAYLATIDKIEPAPMVFYEKWWNNFVNSGSVNHRAVVTLILFWITLIFASVYLFSGNIILRKITFFGTFIFLIAGFFTWYLTFSQHNHLNNNLGAIIFAESAYVKSSPDDKSSNLFMLHSGTRIEVIDELQDWKKIRIANGNEGWVEKEAIEII